MRTPPVFLAGAQGQMLGLAAIYSGRGNEVARAALYKRVTKNIASGSLKGEWQLFQLDGERALEFLLPLLENDASTVPEDNLGAIASSLEDCLGEEWVREWLEEQPADSKVAASVRNWRKPPPQEKPREKVTTLEELLATFEKSWHAASSFLEHASDDEFRRAAENLPSNEKLLGRYLRRVFVRRRWPIEPEPLFELTKSKNWGVRRGAFRVLEEIQSPVVRRFGLKELKKRWNGPLASDLLLKNYRPGDEELVRQRADHSRDLDELHSVLTTLLKMVERQPDVADEYVTYLYDSMPCSFCRFFVVKEMIKRGLMTDAVREECRYDASEDTRELVAGLE